VGFRNRIVVLIEWAYAYFTYQAGVRLITDVERYKPLATTNSELITTTERVRGVSR